MRLPRITVLYNEPTLPPDHPDAASEHDVLDTTDIIAKVLQTAGLPVSRLGITDNVEALIAGLKAQSPDAVFNLFEGTAKWGNTEAYVAGVLELLRVPFTGSSVQPVTLAKSKTLTKHLLQSAGLPTAKFLMLESLPVPVDPLPWPVIVKPGLEDASIGIDQKSVVKNQQELEARVEYVLKTYGPPVLIEQFVRGREFHIAVWDRGDGPFTLPFTEIVFLEQEGDDPLWPIVSFDAKWKPDSRDYKATPVKNPPDPIPPAVERMLSDICVRASELVGYRDYSRVDVRLDANDQAYILEVNPNPCINPLAGVAAALTTAKVEYADFILTLVRSALKRGPHPELANAVGSPDGPASAPVVVRPWDVRPAGALAVELFHESKAIGRATARLSDAEQNVHTLDAIFVEPAHRRKGAGRALLKYLEASTLAAGGRLLTVGVSSGPEVGDFRQFLSLCGYLASGEVCEYFKDGCSRLAYSKVLKPESPGTAVPGLSGTTPAP
ncbi:GNAT family N-acetyltransferase [Limnoglobus roseus]|uniref:D-ala D-ala ligase domain protein n=1 Tax=Limnoglobus roseus TaxID=2598579 RepID=A0A5C1ADS6_9BACT|nr:GNAT family N-acetyltransferase [Limnoglobus roseus]QEL15218.1 D-ala D-ala ligase domain protein [Limnoglobus roseus]